MKEMISYFVMLSFRKMLAKMVVNIVPSAAIVAVIDTGKNSKEYQNPPIPKNPTSARVIIIFLYFSL